MGLGHSPRIVTDGLVLALDAGNPKNYNVGISTNWTDKVGGNNGTLVCGTYHNDGPFVGAGYVEFDGSTEYLSIADSADLRLGTGTFTIEAWIYPHTVSPTYNSSIVVKGSSSAAATWQFDISNTSKLRFQYDASSSFSSSSSLVANVWTHVAVVREGTGTNETKLYINGVLDTTGTVASDFSTTDTMKIGRNRGGGVVTYYNGYISNLRVLKGTALYTSDFTPPSSPLTAVTNTKLLTCQGNSISDASSSGHTITVNGDATANLGFPASAFEFDGVDDYIDCGTSLDYGFGTGDLTVEAWFYANGTQGSNACLLSLKDGSGGDDWQFLAANDQIKVRNIDLVTDEIDYTPNEWHHAAWTRQGSSNYLFLDGIQSGPVSDSTDYDYGLLKVGVNRTSTSFFDGYVSNVRVYKGKGLTAAEVQQNYNALRGRYGI